MPNYIRDLLHYHLGWRNLATQLTVNQKIGSPNLPPRAKKGWTLASPTILKIVAVTGLRVQLRPLLPLLITVRVSEVSPEQKQTSLQSS
jgi:hypothetical protein